MESPWSVLASMPRIAEKGKASRHEEQGRLGLLKLAYDVFAWKVVGNGKVSGQIMEREPYRPHHRGSCL